jgi:hypothetical protein
MPTSGHIEDYIDGLSEETAPDTTNDMLLIRDATDGSMKKIAPDNLVEGIGTVAADPIWDAAGDLAIADGADSAVKLAIGIANQVLTVNAGATAPEWTGAIGVCVSRANALSIPSATPTAITWDNEVRDDGGCWAVGNPTKLYAPIAGWYIINAFAWWDGDDDCGRRLYILANGVTTIGRQSVGVTTYHNDPTNSVSAVYYLSANEYVEIMADQNANNALNIKIGAMAQMARIR